MSKRTDDLEQRLREAIARAEGAEREVAEVSGANGRLAATLDENRKALVKAHEDREAAHSENVTLAKKLEVAIAAQGTMPADLGAVTQVVVDFCVEARTGGSTAGIILARRLETEMGEAGFPVAAAVEIRTQLGGAS